MGSHLLPVPLVITFSSVKQVWWCDCPWPYHIPFIYICSIILIWGQQSSSPCLPSPVTTKSDLRRTALRSYVSFWHLLGLMCDPTEEAWPSLDSGAQRLPRKDVKQGAIVINTLAGSRQKLKYGAPCPENCLLMRCMSYLWIRCGAGSAALSLSQFRVETDLQFLHPISSCGACTVTHKTPFISANPHYLETWTPGLPKCVLQWHSSGECLTFSPSTLIFPECLPATSHCLSSFSIFLCGLLLSHWFLLAFVPFPELGA